MYHLLGKRQALNKSNYIGIYLLNNLELPLIIRNNDEFITCIKIISCIPFLLFGGRFYVLQNSQDEKLNRDFGINFTVVQCMFNNSTYC